MTRCFSTPGAIISPKGPPGATRVVSGWVERYHGQPQMAHPDHIVKPEAADKPAALRRSTPSAGLPPKALNGDPGRARRLPAAEALPIGVTRRPPTRGLGGLARSRPRGHQPAAAAICCPRRRRGGARLRNCWHQLALAFVRRAETPRPSARRRWPVKRRRPRRLGFPDRAQKRRLARSAPTWRPPTHAALAARRCRQRQNRGRLAGHVDAVETGAQAALMAPMKFSPASTCDQSARWPPPLGSRWWC